MSYRKKPVAGAAYSSFVTDKDIERYPDTPVSVPAKPDGTPSSWTELIGAGVMTSEFAICGIGYGPMIATTPDWWFGVIEIGYGEAGAEQVAIQFPVMQRFQTDGYGGRGVAHDFTYFIEPLRKFPAGTRIVVRGNHADVSSLGYITVSVVETTPDLANLTQKDIRSFPAGGYATVNSGATAWTWGSWVEVIPQGTFSGEFVVCGVLAVHPGWTDVERHIYFDGTLQIGENGTPKLAFPLRHDAVPYGEGEAIITAPETIRIFTKFSSGAAVSVRVATSMNEAIPFHVCLQAAELPL